MVDLVQWMTGDRIESVCACGNRISTGGSNFRYNDMTMALVRFSSGMTGSVAANFACVMPHFHGLSVYGTAATFINDASTGRMYVSREKEAAPERIELEYPGTNQNMIIHGFIDSITGEKAPFVAVSEIFDVMAVCMAIEDAAQHDGWLPVQYL